MSTRVLERAGKKNTCKKKNMEHQSQLRKKNSRKEKNPHTCPKALEQPERVKQEKIIKKLFT
jgi:hypothetical protein